MPAGNFAVSKRGPPGTFSGRGASRRSQPSAWALPSWNRNIATVLILLGFRAADPHTIGNANRNPWRDSTRRRKEQRRFGRINADAALYARLGRARKTKPSLILCGEGQRSVLIMVNGAFLDRNRGFLNRCG